MDEDLPNEEIARLRDNINSLSDDLKKLTGIMAKNTVVMAQMLPASERAKQGLDDLNDSIGEVDEAERARLQAIKLNKDRVEALTSGFDSLIYGAKNFTAALGDASNSVAKLKGLVDGGGGAIEGMIKFMTAGNERLGAAASGAVKAITGMAGLALEQTESMAKSVDSLAGIGAASNLTAIELRTLGTQAGYSWKNLEKFAQFAATAGKNLVALGGSSSAGVQAFSQFVAVGDEQLKKFRQLGFEQDKVTELMTFLATQQIQGGQVQRKGEEAMKSLQKATLATMDRMIAFSEIMGFSIEEQKKAVEYQTSQRNFQLFLFEQSKRAAALEESAQQATGEKRQAMMAEAAQIRASVEAKKQGGQLAYQMGGEEMAKAFYELTSVKEGVGALASEETQRLQLLFGDRLYEVLDRFNKNPEQAAKLFGVELVRAAEFTNRTLVQQYEGLGPVQTQVADQFMVTSKLVQNLVNLYDPEQLAKFGGDQAKYIESLLEEVARQQGKLTQAGVTGEVLKGPQREVDQTMARVAEIESFFRKAQAGLAAVVDEFNPFTNSLASSAIKLGILGAAAAAAAYGLTYMSQRVLRDGIPGSGPIVPGGGRGGPTPPPGSNKPTIRKRGPGGVYREVPNPDYIPPSGQEQGRGGRGRFGLRRPGIGLAGLLTSLGTPYLIDALGGEGTTGGALTNILAQTGGMAATGSMFGPWGTAIGGALGLGTGLFQSGGTLMNNLFGGGENAAGGPDEFDQRKAEQQLQDQLDAVSNTSSVSDQLLRINELQLDNLVAANQSLSTIKGGIIKLAGLGEQDLLTREAEAVGKTAEEVALEKAVAESATTEDRERNMVALLQEQLNLGKITQEHVKRGMATADQMTAYSDIKTGGAYSAQTVSEFGELFNIGREGVSLKQDARQIAMASPNYGRMRQNRELSSVFGTAGPSSEQGGITADQLRAMGVKLRETGDVQRAGAYVSPNLISKIKDLQDMPMDPAFAYISSLNDQFHLDRNSNHKVGKAVDFTLQGTPTRQQGEAIRQTLQRMGFINVRDEYNDPSAGATGGHFHAEVSAMNGAWLSGALGGYNKNVTFHGSEVITPAPSNSILKDFFTQPNTPDNTPAKAEDVEKMVTVQQVSMNDMLRAQREITDKHGKEMIARLDNIASILENATGIQSDILKYTKS